VDPFNWIRVHPLMSKAVTAVYPFDHAGVGETSLMLALAPEVVEMDRVGENRGWYTEGAEAASAKLGERGVALILVHLREVLGR
jgi:creatinine amidohydrolase